MGSLIEVPEAVFQVPGLSHQRALWADMRAESETAIVGPLGCGKSYGLAVKQAILRRVNAGVDGLLVVPTFTMARGVHIPEWPVIWKSNLGIDVKYEAQRQAFLWPWGSRTWIRSAENPARLAGPNLGDATFDEPGQISREAYERGSGRVRHPAAKVLQTVLGGTPEGINWFADLFAHPKGNRRTIWGRSWHASLARAYPRKLVDLYGYDDSLLDAYGRGKFVPLRVGRCYKPFDRAVHQAHEPAHDPSLPLILACDFNIDTMRWEIAQMTTREIRFLDEIALGRGGTTEIAAKEFVRRWSTRHRGSVIVTGDASGKARSTSGPNDYQVITEELRGRFRDVTFNIPKDNPLHKDRVDLTNYHLSGRGMSIHLSPRVEELPKDWERVAWKKGTQSIDKPKDDEGSLRTHASDAADYLIWQMARVVGIGARISTHVGGADPTFRGGVATMGF